jgi:hypothetical protein
MKYHTLIDCSDSGVHWWLNLDRETLLSSLVLPFVQKQVVPVRFKGQSGVMNLGAVSYLRIYKTESPLRNLGMLNVLWIRICATECTNEILDTARLQNASEESRSLLQNALAPLVDQVFVVMQFGNKLLESAYQGVIRPICSEYGLTALRIDEIQNSGRITDQILTEISRSRLVLCDLSGERPNCYYEAGFAHALGKAMILTVHKDDEIHFDLAGYRFIVWETEMELRNKLLARFAVMREQSLLGGSSSEPPAPGCTEPAGGSAEPEP